MSRVLIVDDEPDIRELLQLTLLKMGLDVDTAASVKDACQRVVPTWCSPTCGCPTAKACR